MEFFLLVGNSALALFIISIFVCIISTTVAIASRVDGKGEFYPAGKKIAIWAFVVLTVTGTLMNVSQGIIQTRKDMILIHYTDKEKVDELEAIAIEAIQKALDIAEEAVK